MYLSPASVRISPIVDALSNASHNRSLHFLDCALGGMRTMNTSFELQCSAPDAAQSLPSSLSPPSRCTLNTRASSPETYVTQSLQKFGGMGRLFLTPNLNPEPQNLNHLVSALGYCSAGHATERPALGAGSHPKSLWQSEAASYCMGFHWDNGKENGNPGSL